MLKKIYSKTNLIDSVILKPGINIIIGKYSGNAKAMGINGIGKSTLIRLIDYCFISDSSEKIFLGPRYDFLRLERHSISLDLSINGEDYTITRSFEEDSKVFLTLKGNTESYDRKEARTLFTNLFFPTTNQQCLIEGDRFRTIFRFFIKDDLNNLKRVDPFDLLGYTKNKVDLAIYNFFLLGVLNSATCSYKMNLDIYTEFVKLAKSLEDRVKEEVGKEISQLKTEKLLLEREIEKVKVTLDEYKFLDNYKITEKEISDLTQKIRGYLSEHSKIESQIKKMELSLEKDLNINTEKVKFLYDEVTNNLGTILVKKIEDVIKFKNEILENRNKYILKRTRELNLERQDLEKIIADLEVIRSSKYKVLNEKGILDSIKNSYEKYIEKKSTVDQFAGYISQHEGLVEKISDKRSDIEKDKADILQQVKSSEDIIENLRSLFVEILQNAIFVDETIESSSYFDIKLKTKGSSIVSLPFTVEIHVPKADALGQSRLKIVADDLMVFLNILNSRRKLPHFLIHDGVFHGIFEKTVIHTLNFVDEQFKKSKDAQYIVTFNEDELTIDDTNRYGKFNFDLKSKIVAVYSDKASEMIFRRNFS